MPSFSLLPGSRRRAALAGVLALALGTAVLAQSQAPGRFDLQAPIPFDQAVLTGTLPNGLTYFIRQNDRPASRVTLRLAVKAGSLDEADDQLGLAHLIEHMAFNGSDHFAPGALVAYFESTGAQFGPHVNAYTSFDETVYMLELPSDKPDIVRQGLTAFADFAGGLTLDPEQVDRERGVVIEEWRGRLGAGSRIQDQQIPVLFYQSRYADRLPIGKPEILQTAPVARLRSFYDTWYRPDRMALVVVGDVNAQETLALVQSLFAPISARAARVERTPAPVPLHDNLLISIVTDPEMTQSSVELVRKEPSREDTSVGDYRRVLVEQLFARMFNDRLNELGRRPDAPFLSAGGGSGSLTPDVDTFSLSARVQDGRIPEGLAAVLIEARRAGQFGFLPAELDRAKRSMMAFYERAYNERDRTESASYAREYVSHFLVGEPSPGIQYEYQLVENVLPGVTLDEIAALARAHLTGQPHAILAVAPEKPGLAPPTEAQLRQALVDAEGADIRPWTEGTTALTLMETKPVPGAVASRQTLDDLGVTILRFANGVEAWLKPTDFKNDQIVFTMYAKGGSSLAAPDAYITASLAASYVGFAGVGGLRATEMQRLLAGKSANASPFISDSTHGISGAAAPADLETALQRLYLSVTQPTEDPEAFALMKRQLEAALANRGQSPGQVFGERVAEINTSGHYTAKPLTPEDVTALNLDAILDFYRARFGNAADFTFFMVGAFDPAAVTPLLAQYLGSLPSTGRATSNYRDLGVHFPTGIIQDTVRKGREPRANTVLSFFADTGPDPVVQERLLAATSVLEIALRDLLREDLGQTYSVSVGLNQPLPQRGSGYTQVSFAAAPENIESMAERVIGEIRRLQNEAPTAEVIANVKEAARRSYETSLKENSYWMRRLQSIHLFGGNPGDIINRTERIDAITPSIVQDAFKQYFPLDRYTVVTLLPE